MHSVFLTKIHTLNVKKHTIFCQRQSCVANYEDIAYAKPCGKLCDG